MASAKIIVEKQSRNPVPVIKQNLLAGFHHLAPVLAAAGKAEAPVLREPDPRRRPGALRDSVGAQVDERRAELQFYVGGKSGADDVYYAHMVEYGTVASRPNPFMRRTLRKHKGQIRDMIEAAARKPV